MFYNNNNNDIIIITIINILIQIEKVIGDIKVIWGTYWFVAVGRLGITISHK